MSVKWIRLHCHLVIKSYRNYVSLKCSGYNNSTYSGFGSWFQVKINQDSFEEKDCLFNELKQAKEKRQQK